MTSRKLAVGLEKLAKIKQKQGNNMSNFYNSSDVNENADASAIVSDTSSDKGQKELLEELSQSITVIKATIKDLAKQIEEKQKEWMTANSMEDVLSAVLSLLQHDEKYIQFITYELYTSSFSNLEQRKRKTHM